MEIWKLVSGVIIEDDNDTSAFLEHSVIRFLWILLPDFSSHISLDFVARFVSPHIAQRFHFPARGPAKHVPLKTTINFSSFQI